MYMLLRVVRGLFGFIFALQIVGLIPVLSWFSDPSAITGALLAKVIIKLIALALTGCVFIYSRKAINALHTKFKGEPHPSLLGTWSL